MAELKREYVVPLRNRVRTAPKWRRSKKAVSVLKDFIRQHMKTENVVVCSELNEKIWHHGSKCPPSKVSVITVKTTIDGVEVALVNLKEIGVDAQLALYSSQKEQLKKSLEEGKKDDAAPVQDAQVTEKTDAKAEEKKDEAPKAKKKTTKEGAKQ